jgi:hypothetical protein
MWHVKNFSLINSSMDEMSRAALWYAENGFITDSTFSGIKAIRDCEHIQLVKCKIISQEFGWKSKDIIMEDTDITSEYLFLDSKNIRLNNVRMQGKYSFQYNENLNITNSELNTKDAFWHSKNITVRNCTIKGEYLGWFSIGLTLVDCKIIGTQPLCYCINLRLINCTMEDTDLAFEYSEVEADINGHIDSIKNPKSGTITADSVGKIIQEKAVMDCSGKVVIRNSVLQTG